MDRRRRRGPGRHLNHHPWIDLSLSLSLSLYFFRKEIRRGVWFLGRREESEFVFLLRQSITSWKKPRQLGFAASFLMLSTNGLRFLLLLPLSPNLTEYASLSFKWYLEYTLRRIPFFFFLLWLLEFSLVFLFIYNHLYARKFDWRFGN